MQLRLQSPRDRVFAVVAWLALLGGVVGTALSIMARPAHWFATSAIAVGVGGVVALASFALFGWRGRARNGIFLVGATVVLLLVSVGFHACLVALQYAPRRLTLGTTRGSVAEVIAHPAAWVDVTPASVDRSRIRTAVDTTGISRYERRRNTSVAVAPILPPASERTSVVLIACGVSREHLEQGFPSSGTVSGLMRTPGGLERAAVTQIPDFIYANDQLRCIVPGTRAGTFYVVVWILFVLAMTSIAAAAVILVRA